MSEKKTNTKSLLQIQLENEAKAKEILDKDQITELNRAMIEGKDLEKAAKAIFGPKPDQTRKPSNMRVKKQDQLFYDSKNYN